MLTSIFTTDVLFPLPLGEGYGEGVTDNERRISLGSSCRLKPSPHLSPRGRGGNFIVASSFSFSSSATNQVSLQVVQSSSPHRHRLPLPECRPYVASSCPVSRHR